MRTVTITISLLLLGCSSRVRVNVPAAPAVQVPTRAVAIVSDSRACSEVADRLADQLRSAGLEVRPDALARVTVFACNHSWTVDAASHVEGRGHALASLSVLGETTAHLVGAAGDATTNASLDDTLVRFRRRVVNTLDDRVARDLAEQLAPEPLPVRRRVYANSTAGSARSFHNLAVAAEREGRWQDALWWAERAHERQPSSDRARYVDELARVVRRVGNASL